MADFLRKTLGIAHAEFRFGLRRGAPVVTTLLIGIIFGAGLLLGPLSNLSIQQDEFNKLTNDPAVLEKWAQKGITVDFFRQTTAEVLGEMTVLGMPLAWPILLLTTFIFLPAAAAASMPGDKAFGTAELLRSLPINGWTYLTGKFFGFLSVVVLMGLIPLGLFLVVLEVSLLTTFHAGLPPGLVWFFFEFSLVDVLPMFLWAIGIGMLAGVPFKTRRAAIFPGLLAGIFSSAFWLSIFNTGYKVWPSTELDLAAYYLIRNFHSPALETLSRLAGVEPYKVLGPDAPIVGLERVIGRDLFLLAGLLLVAVLIRLWYSRKENF